MKIAELASGVSQAFTLSVPVDKLELDEDGVYQLGVSLSGRPRPRLRPGAGHRADLPALAARGRRKKTQLTYLWPLISSAHLTAETGSDEQQTPVFADDDLAKELAPGGRLEQMVSLGNELPVTWVIDPDLLATVDAMTRNYRVKERRHHRRRHEPGRRQAVAERSSRRRYRARRSSPCPSPTPTSPPSPTAARTSPARSAICSPPPRWPRRPWRPSST